MDDITGNRPPCYDTSDGTAAFSSAFSGQKVLGVCLYGYYGNPSKTCGDNGQQVGIWSVTFDPCQCTISFFSFFFFFLQKR